MTVEGEKSHDDANVFGLDILYYGMADNKSGRDKQAADEERRQRERELEEARDRADEAEPVHDETGERLGNLDDALETHDYPMTTEELIETYGDYEVETQGGTRSIAEVFASIDNERYDSADDVQTRIQGLIRR